MSEISIDPVIRGPRVRGIDESRVTVLVASIGEVGLMNPITVAPWPLVRDGIVLSRWILISGLNRLEAMKYLGRVTIDATITDLSGPAAMIAECLIVGASCRADLLQSTGSRRLGRHWRRPPQKRRSPALAGTSNRADSEINNMPNSTPNRHTQPTIFIWHPYLDGKASWRLLPGRHDAAEPPTRRASRGAL